MLLALAVVLWLVLMEAGLHGDGGMQQGPHALRHSDSGVSQLQELGRMLLARRVPDHCGHTCIHDCTCYWWARHVGRQHTFGCLCTNYRQL